MAVDPLQSAGLPVAFVNENTLGHVSYLPRFVRELERRPELGIVPRMLDVIPMPPELQRRADHTVRGLRRFGLDFHIARWRRIASARARVLVDELRRRERLAAIVVNTQSVALDLAEIAPELPLFVCLDATFAQLARSRWFAMNRVAGWLLPLTLAPIRGRERRLLAAATRHLVWSAPVRQSLRTEYGVADERIGTLPPSLDLNRLRVRPVPTPSNTRPRLLFLGGDFRRKGGPVLLQAFRERFASRCELHVVTQTAVEPEPGVFVHRDVAAGSEAWHEQWARADLFVFPSGLETFGIVLAEALALGVPVVSSRAGAAADILEDGRNGVLVREVNVATLAGAIEVVLTNPAAARERALRGRARVERDFDLTRNTERLAEWLRRAR